MTGMLATSAVPLSYAFASQAQGGRISLPVPPSQLLYANFEHVGGVPASPGEPVASIDRLKILDTLIDRLASMRSQPLASRERPEGLSSERIDALIQQYGAELRSKALAPLGVGYRLAPVESGMLFSLAS